MRLLNVLGRILIEAARNRGYEHARLELLNLSDRQLADNGFSRELLLQGVKAWPWKLDEDTEQPLNLQAIGTHDIALKSELNSLVQAINELSIYTDNELSDLGISRHDIADAVRHGRRYVEYPMEQSSQVA